MVSRGHRYNGAVPPKKESAVRITLRLPDDLHEDVRATADDERRSLNRQIEVLLREALERRKRKP